MSAGAGAAGAAGVRLSAPNINTMHTDTTRGVNVNYFIFFVIHPHSKFTV